MPRNEDGWVPASGSGGRFFTGEPGGNWGDGGGGGGIRHIRRAGKRKDNVL